MNIDGRDDEIMKVDGFRFITSLHTTARQLSICSEITRKLHNKHLPKEILEKILFKWSNDRETNDSDYKKSKGKLTENGLKTTAFPNYLELTSSLKLTTHLNDIYSCSRLSYILLHFINDKKDYSFSLPEKIFFMYQLLTVDADGILYIIDELKKGEKNQKQLLVDFKDNFTKRLLAKQSLSSSLIKNTISERYRTINFIWKKPETYAEHLLIPRCEWLKTLGIIQIEKKGSNTVYSLSENGFKFLKKIPVIAKYNIIDVTERWIVNSLFKSLYFVVNEEIQYFENLPDKQKLEEFEKSLLNALKNVKTSNSIKIPLLDCLVFICIDFLTNKKIIIEMIDIINLLKGGIIIGIKSFNLKDEGRINESYIITNII